MPIAPKATTTFTFFSSASSRIRYGRQASISSGLRLIVRRDTTYRRRNVRIVKLQAVVSIHAGGLAREAGFKQCRIKKVAGKRVSREHSARAVRAVGARGQVPQSQQTMLCASPNPGTALLQYSWSR